MRSNIKFLILTSIDQFFQTVNLENKNRTPSRSRKNFIKIIEVTATFILITDLVFWYRKAKSGYDFVTRNWIKIIAVFPFAFFFRALSILRVEAMFPAAGFEVVAFFNKMPSWVQTTAKLKEFVEV